MNKIIIAFALLFAIVASRQKVGGWQKLDTTALSEGAYQALQIAVTNVQKALQESNTGVSFKAVNQAQGQVVAGYKYKFQISFAIEQGSDKNYEVVVWEQPAGFDGPEIKYVVMSVVDLDATLTNLIITGGWSDADSDNLDDYASAALSKAVQAVKSRFKNSSPSYQGVESVKTQVVAGINYKFVIAFDLGRFEVVVFRRLDGTFKVTQTTQLNNRLGVAGGWSQLDANNLDADAKRAANFAIGAIRSQFASSEQKFNSVINAQSQVVAGINYKFHIEFTIGGGRVHFEVVVWKQLDGSLKVTSILQANDVVVPKRKLGLAGGWSQLDANNLDSEAKQAANFAISAVSRLVSSAKGEFSNVITVQRQIVAGTNYKFHIEFTVDGGRVHYEVVVWKQLDGNLKVTSIQQAN